MNKIYKVILRLFQQVNYYIYKYHLINKRNILSEIDFDMERLPNTFVKGMSREIRINKKFPAGKAFNIEVEGNNLTIEVLYKFRRLLNNMNNQGTSGIDIYILNQKGKYIWKETLAPSKDYQMFVKKIVYLDGENNKLKFIMPSFAIVEGIFLSQYRAVRVGEDEDIDIVAYGSSITHGCAASRPGLSYLNQISNLLGCGILNYGFSEAAKGEEKLLRYISLVPAKVFIMEYDHNVSVDELERTHKKAYETIRMNFKGWIIMLSRFSGGLSIAYDEEMRRIEIIQNTYKYAKSIGDQQIIFYNGSRLFGDNKECYFIDKVHPNDEGMTVIANKIFTLIQEKGMLK